MERAINIIGLVGMWIAIAVIASTQGYVWAETQEWVSIVTYFNITSSWQAALIWFGLVGAAAGVVYLLFKFISKADDAIDILFSVID